VTADEQGITRVRGFCGDYEVQVAANGKTTTQTATLARDGNELTIVLK
jgi:hypothetical protein